MRSAPRRAEDGMAVVAVMVLIAVLFLSGTVMALTVSSSLHTVDIVIAQDAVHYAAESAVARGAAGLKPTGGCGYDPLSTLNGQPLRIWCSPALSGTDLTEPGETKVHSLSAQNQGSCAWVTLPSAVSTKTAWTVVGWRGSGSVQVWTDATPGCVSAGISNCDQSGVFTNVVFVRCRPKAPNLILHIAGSDAGIALGTSVVRWAPEDADRVTTVVGAAGFEVDEADAVLTEGPARTVQLLLWNTVLP